MSEGRTASQSGKRTLDDARTAKTDEFYTQLVDIENELKHYKEQLNGKVVLCNCDDPKESKFFEYFALNFNTLGLKKLIATSYAGSPIVGGQLPLIEIEGLKPEGKEPYLVEINEVLDFNSDGAINLLDVDYLLRHDKNASRPLKGDENYCGGDFRSSECLNVLREADVVVTNPPFSLFREFLDILEEHNKTFLIIGNTNAITYKEVFALIKQNKFRTGYTKFNVGMFFEVPGHWVKYHHIDEHTGKKMARVSTSCWFTNMEVKKHKEFLPLYKKYSPAAYPKYENYDAIEVGKVADIPVDYDGVMGVPITFLDKYNPDQFEILGSNLTLGIPMAQIAEKGTYPQGGPSFYLCNVNGTYRRVYTRIVIKRK
ncbi:MAG: adenine-specific methyltransferase EcoRI family protein [Fimbriimonadaceae bacterium]